MKIEVPVGIYPTRTREVIVVGGGKYSSIDFPIDPWEYTSTKDETAEPVNLIGGGKTRIRKIHHNIIPTKENADKTTSLKIDYALELVKDYPDIVRGLIKKPYEPYPVFIDIETDSKEGHFSKADRDEIISIQVKYPNIDTMIFYQKEGVSEIDIIKLALQAIAISPNGLVPDFIVGYNSNRFDIPYIKTRIRKLSGRDPGLKDLLYRLRRTDNEIMYPTWVRAKKGRKDTDIDIAPGFASLDLYEHAKSDLVLRTLPSRTLENVAKAYGAEGVVEIDKDTKSRMRRLMESDLSLFTAYAIDDVIQTEYLYNIYSQRLISSSNLLSCPMIMIHHASSGQKSYIALYRECRKHGYYSVVKNKDRYKDLYDRAPKYQGATVECYKTGYFNKIVYLDCKCVHPDTEVITQTGYKRISEIAKGDKILNDMRWCTVLHKQNTNRTELIDIRTRSGNTITVSKEHLFPVYTQRLPGYGGKGKIEQKDAGSLKRGDILLECYDITLESDSSPSISSKECNIAWLLGIFDAEGYMQRSIRDRIRHDRNGMTQKNIKYSQLSFTIHQDELELKYMITEYMKIISPESKPNIQQKTNSLGISLQWGSHDVYDKMMTITESRDRILENIHLCRNYLNGMFSGDGTYNKRRKTISLTQSVKNEANVQFVHKCLTRCGIPHMISAPLDAKIKDKVYKKKMIEVSTSFVKRFMDEIGITGEKKRRVQTKGINNNCNIHRYKDGYMLTRISTITHRKEESQPMVDIMIDSSSHPYFFANNILTHNSMYPNIIHDYNISFDRYKLEEIIEYDNVEDMDFSARKWSEVAPELGLEGLPPQVVSHGLPNDRIIYIPDDNYKLVFKFRVNLIDDGFMRKMVNHFNNVRADYRKKGDIATEEGDDIKAMMYQSMQQEAKVLNNTFYGVLAQKYYEVADLPAAIFVTAIGRWIMAEMIKLFGNSCLELDSVTGDTPLYVIDTDSKLIDIIPIEDLHSGSKKREIYTGKYKVWTRSGWSDILYTKRHMVTKPIYRVKCSNAMVDCTSDHSLFDADSKKEVSPSTISIGDRIEICSSPSVDIHLKTKNTLPLDKDLAWLYGLFLAEGSYSCVTRKTGGYSKNMSISMSSLKDIQRAQDICNDKLALYCTADSSNTICRVGLYDTMKSSSTYRITGFGSQRAMSFFRHNFYTNNGDGKKVPKEILNCKDVEILNAFISGYETGDGYISINVDKHSGTRRKVRVTTSVDRCLSAGIRFILLRLGHLTTICIRKDKHKVVDIKVRHPYPKSGYRNIDIQKVSINRVLYNDGSPTPVYDISTKDNTFVSALGEIVLHNTDGAILDRTIIPEGLEDIDKVNEIMMDVQHKFFGVRKDKLNFKLEFEGAGSIYLYKQKNYILRTDDDTNKLKTKGSAFSGYDKAPVIQNAVKIMSQAVMNVGEHKDLEYGVARKLAGSIRHLPLEHFKFSKTLRKDPATYKGYDSIYVAVHTVDINDLSKKDALADMKREARTYLHRKFKNEKSVDRRSNKRSYVQLIKDCETIDQLDIVLRVISEAEEHSAGTGRHFMLTLAMMLLKKGRIVEEDDIIEYYFTKTSNRLSLAEDVDTMENIDIDRYERQIDKICQRFSLADDTIQELSLDLM